MGKSRIETIFVGNSLRNFTYLIPSGENYYYCVDPFDAKGIEARLEKIGGQLKGIINTHQHFDHICGNGELLNDFPGIPLYAHHKASYDQDFVGLDHGDFLELDLENRIVFWDTPGHTMTHLSLLMVYQEKAWAILSGDTMFNAGVGHCKLGGHPEILFETMSKIYGALDDKIEIYPGHEYFENNLKFSLSCEPENRDTSVLLEKVSAICWEDDIFRVTMGDERKVNPFLRLDSAGIRKQLEMVTASDKDVFLKLRSMRNNW